MSETAAFLSHEREAILQSAGAALARMHASHYESAGAEEIRGRLGALFDRLLEGLAEHDLGPVIAYAQDVAEERYRAGYDLSEVQTAFNALEEATWTRAIAKLDPSAGAAGRRPPPPSID